MKRVFDYKVISEEKRVNLVVLKLEKCASLWWTNLLAKRARKRKRKI